MDNQNKRTAISDFTEELIAAYYLDNSSFADLYSWHYFDISSALKKEIMDNLNSLSSSRFNAYIKYVKNEIHEVHGYYDPDECIIEEWIIKFDLNEGDFPFYGNKKVTRMLSVTKKNYDSESIKTGENIRLMQLKFHWYAGHLEYLKMKRFIDELLEPERILQQSVVPDGRKNDNAYKNTAWFKIGLCFANGKAQGLYCKYKSEKGHFTKITSELGFKKTDRPYFSETINNSTNSDKNIYNDLTKMKKIFDYCKKNEILICEDFDNNFNALQAK